jgi:hypothetical protein
MVNCTRCNVPLVFQGMRESPENSLLVVEGKFEGSVYICPECGAIELFDPDVGTDRREDNPMASGGGER